MGFVDAPSTGGLALTFPAFIPAWEWGAAWKLELFLTFPELLDFQRSGFGSQRESRGPQLIPVPWDIVGFIFQDIVGFIAHCGHDGH